MPKRVGLTWLLGIGEQKEKEKGGGRITFIMKILLARSLIRHHSPPNNHGSPRHPNHHLHPPLHLHLPLSSTPLIEMARCLLPYPSCHSLQRTNHNHRWKYWIRIRNGARLGTKRWARGTRLSRYYFRRKSCQ